MIDYQFLVSRINTVDKRYFISFERRQKGFFHDRERREFDVLNICTFVGVTTS